jgi:hypothetical protein
MDGGSAQQRQQANHEFREALSCILAFLQSRVRAIWFQRPNNRSPKIDQSYPSLLLLT